MGKIVAEIGIFVALLCFIIYCYELLAEQFSLFSIIIVCLSWYSIIYYFIKYMEK